MNMPLNLYLSESLVKAGPKPPPRPKTAAVANLGAPKAPAAPKAEAPKMPNPAAGGTGSTPKVPNPSAGSAGSSPSGSKASGGGSSQPKDYYSKKDYPERPNNAIDETDANWVLPKGQSPQYNKQAKPQEEQGQQQGQQQPQGQGAGSKPVDENGKVVAHSPQESGDPYAPVSHEPPKDPLQQNAQAQNDAQARAAKKAALKQKLNQPFGTPEPPKQGEATPEEVAQRSGFGAAKDEDLNPTTLATMAHLHEQMKNPSERDRYLKLMEEKTKDFTPEQHAELSEKLKQVGNATTDKLSAKHGGLAAMGKLDKIKNPMDDTEEEAKDRIRPEHTQPESWLRPQKHEADVKHEYLADKYVGGHKAKEDARDVKRHTIEGPRKAKERFESELEAYNKQQAAAAEQTEGHEQKLQEYEDTRNALSNKLKDTTEKLKGLKQKHKEALDEAHKDILSEHERGIEEHKAKTDKALADHTKELEKIKTQVSEHNKNKPKLDRPKKGASPEEMKKYEAAKQKADNEHKYKGHLLDAELTKKTKEIEKVKTSAKGELDKLTKELKEVKSNKDKLKEHPKVSKIQKQIDEAEEDIKATKLHQEDNEFNKPKPPKDKAKQRVYQPRKPETAQENIHRDAHRHEAQSMADKLRSHIENNPDMDESDREEMKKLHEELMTHAHLEHVPDKQHKYELRTISQRARQLGGHEDYNEKKAKAEAKESKVRAGEAKQQAREQAKAEREQAKKDKQAEREQAKKDKAAGKSKDRTFKSPENAMEHAQVDSHRRRAHQMKQNIMSHLKHNKNMDPNTRKYLEDMVKPGGELDAHANTDFVPDAEHSKNLRQIQGAVKDFSSKPHPNDQPEKAGAKGKGTSFEQAWKRGGHVGEQLASAGASSGAGGAFVPMLTSKPIGGIITGGHKLLSGGDKKESPTAQDAKSGYKYQTKPLASEPAQSVTGPTASNQQTSNPGDVQPPEMRQLPPPGQGAATQIRNEMKVKKSLTSLESELRTTELDRAMISMKLRNIKRF
jgi:hypothetical protein